MNPTRRSLALLFPALVAAQQGSQPAAAQKGMLPSKAYPFEQLTGKQTATINSYQILTGDTHSGYKVDLHESELPGGMASRILRTSTCMRKCFSFGKAKWK